MSTRLPKHLFDARAAAVAACRFAQGLDLQAYANNALVRSAVERQLEILGEAARRALETSPDLRARIPGLALAVGLRNRIIHGYDKVENEVVFDTVMRDLPPLIDTLDDELQRYSPPPGS